MKMWDKEGKSSDEIAKKLRLNSADTKTLKGLPRVQKPGASPTRRRAQAGDDVTEARQRVSRTGATTEDAVGLVRRLLG